MAQQVEALATKPDNLSSIPGTHSWKERTGFLKLSSDLHTFATPIHISKYNYKVKPTTYNLYLTSRFRQWSQALCGMSAWMVLSVKAATHSARVNVAGNTSDCMLHVRNFTVAIFCIPPIRLCDSPMQGHNHSLRCWNLEEGDWV